MPRPDDGPTKPVRVTPEDFHRVAQQFAYAGGAEFGVFKIRDNLFAGLAPAAGWAGVDDAAMEFGRQFSAAFDQLWVGFDRAGQVLGDVGFGIDLSARNHWLADQAATPGAAAEPPWTPVMPRLVISAPQQPFPMIGNATVGGLGAQIAIAVDGVLTAVNVTGRLAAIGGVVGGVVGVMSVAIENTPSPNVGSGTNPKVTDEQITTEATSVADSAGGAAEVSGSRGAGEIPTPHGRPGSLNDLNAQQVTNYERYVRKLPAKSEPVQVEILADGGVRLSTRVPANNIPGSYAEYIKIIDRNGNTVQYVKNTYDGSGNIVHSKIK